MSIDPGHVVEAVACPSTSECVAVDASGNAIEGDPLAASWTVQRIRGAAPLTAVACASPTLCSAVDVVGHAFVGSAPPAPTGGNPTPTPGTGQPPPAPRPVISAASLSHRRFRVARAPTAVLARAPRGTTFKFTLSRAATLRIAISYRAPGMRKGSRCLAPSRRPTHAHAKRCTRTLIAGTLTRRTELAGADAVAFSGRIGRRALAPRAYRAVLTASDSAGSSKPVELAFSVVR
jgi:hypothetical protein